MAFIPLKNFLSIWHFKLVGLIGPRAVSERVKHFNNCPNITEQSLALRTSACTLVQNNFSSE
jgi:hypothetical protein